jgi:hypothetical protein
MPIVKVELSMVIWVVEFSREARKIKRIFGLKSISSKKIIVFCVLYWVVKKCQNLTFKVKSTEFFWFMNINLGAFFCTMHSFYLNFCDTLFSNAQFNNSPLCQITKYNNVLLEYYSLAKNLPNLESHPGKLHNPYYHNKHKDAFAISISGM